MEPPAPQIPEKPLSTYSHLLSTLSSFLTISIHSILYTRSLYPPNTFLLTRAYNYPVYQSRHPLVCKWINDAVSAVMEQVGRGVVDRVGVVVFNPSPTPAASASSSSVEAGDGDGGGNNKGDDGSRGREKRDIIRKGNGGKGEIQILERYMFDLSGFPGIRNKEDFHMEMEREGNGDEGMARSKMKMEMEMEMGDLMVDVEEQLRGAVGRLAVVGGTLGGLPVGCTFSVVVELKDDGGGGGEVAPIGHPQPWIPSTPSLQTGKKKSGSERMGRDLGGVRNLPVRAVEVGEFVMEMWVEEGRAKVLNS